MAQLRNIGVDVKKHKTMLTKSERKFVSKKLGNAVVRNKLKRQLRAIISKNNYQNNFNCIIILGRGILNRTYQEMDENLQIAFKKLNILLGGANEKK